MLDIILFILFFVSVAYCCDIPAFTGFEFFINDHNSMIYGVGLSMIAAYIFYVVQVGLPAIKNKLKYAQFITVKLYDIRDSMRQTVTILTGEHLKDTKEMRTEILQIVLCTSLTALRLNGKMDTE